MFPLAARKRAYVLAPLQTRQPVVVQAGMGIGMDDPRLADKLRDTALGADPSQAPQAMTYRVLAEDGAQELDFLEEFEYDEASRASEESAETATPEAGPSSGTKRRHRLEFLLALLLGGTGATVAYYGTMYLREDTMTWTAAGAGVGLLVGWALIRWLARRS